MLITLKIKNNKFIKKHYNNIATDKDNNKYFITTDKELKKDSYYIINIIDYKFNIDTRGFIIRVLSYNNLNKLTIVNNRLTLNNKLIKAYTYKLSAIELKLIEKYNYLNSLIIAENGLDSFKQGNINDRKKEYIMQEIEKLKNLKIN